MTPSFEPIISKLHTIFHRTWALWTRAPIRHMSPRSQQSVPPRSIYAFAANKTWSRPFNQNRNMHFIYAIRRVIIYCTYTHHYIRGRRHSWIRVIKPVHSGQTTRGTSYCRHQIIMATVPPVLNGLLCLCASDSTPRGANFDIVKIVCLLSHSLRHKPYIHTLFGLEGFLADSANQTQTVYRPDPDGLYMDKMSRQRMGGDFGIENGTGDTDDALFKWQRRTMGWICMYIWSGWTRCRVCMCKRWTISDPLNRLNLFPHMWMDCEKN